jgi:CDP-glycerol glycerophosphotransferase (TagB/SpsB family)
MQDNPYAADQYRHLEQISLRKRKTKTVLFFGRQKAFSDNSKYLYLDACRNDRGFSPVWVTGSAEISALLEARKLPVLLTEGNLTEAQKVFLKAAIAVFCTNPNDSLTDGRLRAALTGAWKLQLWHGVFAGPQDLQVTDLAPAFIPELTYQIYGASSVDATLSPSSRYDDRFAEAFGASLLLQDGYPRNEVLEREPSDDDLAGAWTGPATPPDAAGNILYCPSHTRVGQPVWNDPDLLWTLTRIHAERGLVFHIKPHPFETRLSPEAAELAPGVRLIPALDDIYPALPRFDLLISDYSSIMDDFALTGKPVVVLEHPATEPVRRRLLLKDLHYREMAAVATPETLGETVIRALSAGASGTASIYDRPHSGSSERINRFIGKRTEEICRPRYQSFAPGSAQ